LRTFDIHLLQSHLLQVQPAAHPSQGRASGFEVILGLLQIDDWLKRVPSGDRSLRRRAIRLTRFKRNCFRFVDMGLGSEEKTMRFFLPKDKSHVPSDRPPSASARSLGLVS
jgi:hypothetical protein